MFLVISPKEADLFLWLLTFPPMYHQHRLTSPSYVLGQKKKKQRSAEFPNVNKVNIQDIFFALLLNKKRRQQQQQQQRTVLFPNPISSFK